MSDVIFNIGDNPQYLQRVGWSDIASSTTLRLDLSAATLAQARFSTAPPATELLAGSMDKLQLRANVDNGFTVSGMSFVVGGVRHVVKSNGAVQRDLNPSTGVGTKVGDLVVGTGEVGLDAWPTGAGTGPQVSNFRAVALPLLTGTENPYNTFVVTFRTAAAPLRPGGFSIRGTMLDGTTFNVSADSDGFINTGRVKGRVNYSSGVAILAFTTPTPAAGATPVDLTFLAVAGLSSGYLDYVKVESLRYNAVAYTYLPLDVDLLGIDPVRLPSDGRVPIFRAGGVAVVGHTGVTSPETVAVGDTIAAGRTRLSRVRVLDAGDHVRTTGWNADLEAGTVTFTDVTGYVQPVRVEHRVEDMALVRDAQIDGSISFTRQLTHEYPVGSRVSSALMLGDMKARVSLTFDQATWDGINFTDSLVGNAATATYDVGAHPIDVKNSGATTERWAIQFTSATAFRVVGEHVGVIANGTTTADCAPINPATGQPYFTIRKEGWGSGWVSGNVLRVNTVGAVAPVWIVRTVKQGPNAQDDYTFTLLVRGDKDNPL